MSKSIVIFGAGGIGSRYCESIIKKGEDKVIAFLDNCKAKQGTKIHDIEIYSPENIQKLLYEVVVVVSPGFEGDIINQLKSLGVNESKIQIPEETYAERSMIDIRNQWLYDFAGLVYERGLKGNVAEAGVFRGDFSRHINAAFPDRALYLFDTFEGFPEQDVAKEKIKSNSKAGYYDATSEELVLSKLSHPEKVLIKKGYFPQTAEGLEDTFCFVNLDLDLYEPTYKGLHFFWGKMAKGGAICIHDFYGINFPNVKTAVYDFEHDLGVKLMMMPIGDALSVAIIK